MYEPRLIDARKKRSLGPTPPFDTRSYRALRAAVTEAALPRLEALLLAAERQKRAGLRALVHHAASCRARRPAAAAAVALPPVEQRRRLFLATEAIAVAGQGQGDAGGEQEGQLLALCPRGEYDRATDAFLRQPGEEKHWYALPTFSLCILHMSLHTTYTQARSSPCPTPTSSPSTPAMGPGPPPMSAYHLPPVRCPPLFPPPPPPLQQQQPCRMRSGRG